jgi:tryptophan 2,3-dioxygenase
MEQLIPFEEVLEAIEQLSLDEQETLLDIVQRRVAERGRKLLAAEIQEARQEFATGGCHPATADELMEEILS